MDDLLAGWVTEIERERWKISAPRKKRAGRMDVCAPWKARWRERKLTRPVKSEPDIRIVCRISNVIYIYIYLAIIS